MSAERRTLADTAYETLRSAILDDTFKEGAILNQVALAGEYGMSRVPIREAVQRLIAEGLLVGMSYRRARVAVLGADDVSDLVDIRVELEVLALRRLISSNYEEAYAEAVRLNELLADTSDPEEAVSLDHQFHSALMSAMPSAAGLVIDIRKRTQKYIDRLHVTGSPRPAGAAEHADVLAAIKAGDTDDAIERMRRHIDHTRKLLDDAARSRRSDQR